MVDIFLIKQWALYCLQSAHTTVLELKTTIVTTLLLRN